MSHKCQPFRQENSVVSVQEEQAKVAAEVMDKEVDEATEEGVEVLLNKTKKTKIIIKEADNLEIIKDRDKVKIREK